jgi:hypothetical protein
VEGNLQGKAHTHFLWRNDCCGSTNTHHGGWATCREGHTHTHTHILYRNDCYGSTNTHHRGGRPACGGANTFLYLTYALIAPPIIAVCNYRGGQPQGVGSAHHGTQCGSL